MRHVENLSRTTVKLPPCVIQTHKEGELLVGTYKLEENKGRHGTVDVYTQELELKHSISTTSSILDLKICPWDVSLVATAQSTGSIILWSFESGVLSMKQEHQLFDEKILVLYICFSSSMKKLSATLTTGQVAIINCETMEVENIYDTHEAEAWVSAFGGEGPLSNVIFSGGDDARLVARDLRTEQLIWSNRHIHGSGVTYILPSSNEWMPSSPFVLWTGSYDDRVRSIDLRAIPGENPLQVPPRELDSLNLGGGVWRLVPSPNKTTLLACCMYDGARILDPSKPFKDIVTGTITEGHNSMVYGGSWSNDGTKVFSCSFYDRQLQSWTL